jgi:CO/xanthine dehydrogenase Mo-binding subunit
MPAAIRVGHVQTPSPSTQYGIKGGGEGGRMGAPAALSGAIEDALAQYGVRLRRAAAHAAQGAGTGPGRREAVARAG